MKPLLLLLAFLLFQPLFSQDTIEFRNGIEILQRNGKFGIINGQNEPVFEFDSLADTYLDNYILAKKTKWGLVDSKGQTVIPFEYNALIPTLYEVNKKQIFIARKTDKFGTININNKVVIPLEFDAITGWVEWGPNAHYISKNNKIGIIDYDGKIIIPTEYDSLYYEKDDLIKAKRNGKFGVINKNNEEIIPFIYDALIVDYFYMNPAEQHKVVAKLNGLWTYLSLNGKVIEENISNEKIKEEYKDYQLNNYDFEYIGKCFIKRMPPVWFMKE